ncbi:MAG: type III-A CRISPR-associated RAMP protein Csm3 [Azospirillaceae bacterium]|nr:type III-A CRISPR-associated RAMP protein Csm3 [Azospirillaceae bacterium]
MKLTAIKDIRASLELLTGLHIGAGDTEMRIGGVDKPVVRHPLTREPYIPGSSLKGKVRSLLEWRSGAVQERPLSYENFQGCTGAQHEEVGRIVRLFGLGGGEKVDEEAAKAIGPSRASFHDAGLDAGFAQRIKASNLSFIEIKAETAINRITGTADTGLRQTERVAAGAVFAFRATLRVFEGDPDLLGTLLQGLALLELESLGGAGSRGYGKVHLRDLTCDGRTIALPQDPFLMSSPAA